MAQDHPIKTYRLNRKLSQEELAGELGVSSVTISRWETGARQIDTDLLPDISLKTGIAKAALRPDLAGIFAPESAA